MIAGLFLCAGAGAADSDNACDEVRATPPYTAKTGSANLSDPEVQRQIKQSVDCNARPHMILELANHSAIMLINFEKSRQQDDRLEIAGTLAERKRDRSGTVTPFPEGSPCHLIESLSLRDRFVQCYQVHYKGRHFGPVRFHENNPHYFADTVEQALQNIPAIALEVLSKLESVKIAAIKEHGLPDLAGKPNFSEAMTEHPTDAALLGSGYAPDFNSPSLWKHTGAANEEYAKLLASFQTLLELELAFISPNTVHCTKEGADPIVLKGPSLVDLKKYLLPRHENYRCLSTAMGVSTHDVFSAMESAGFRYENGTWNRD